MIYREGDQCLQMVGFTALLYNRKLVGLSREEDTVALG
jgi:hypothetical protein